MHHFAQDGPVPWESEKHLVSRDEAHMYGVRMQVLRDTSTAENAGTSAWGSYEISLLSPRYDYGSDKQGSCEGIKGKKLHCCPTSC